jgi:Bacterial Ig-like domain
MKRRALAAVLFVLALAALAVAGCGSTNRQDTEAIKGKPWRGSEGTTLRVGKLVSGRFQERHSSATVPEVHADASSGAAGEAEARAERVGRRVREKPEPGEEGGGTKRAGAAVAPQRTGKSAITPSQAVSPGSNFLGSQLNQSGFVPPDSMGAVGPSQVMVDVNGRIRVFDKQGNLNALDLTDSAFWAPVRNGAEPTDPGVEYDRLSQRWIVSAINVEGTNNRVMLAVSNGPTISNASSFTYYFFNEASPSPSGPSRFADYPQLGVDANAIYIGVNEFTSSSGSFSGTSAFVIRKSSVLGGGPIVVTAFRNLVSGSAGAGPSSPQPATDMNPSVGSGYIVGPDNQVFGKIDIRRISDPGGTPSISGNLGVVVPTTAAPLEVPAQGTPGGLDALDDRLFEAMIGTAPDGTVSLWTAHNIRMNAAGIGSAAGDRDGARWYQIGNLDTSPTLAAPFGQSGQVFDTAPNNPAFYWMPSIAMNGQGHASINMSTAGPGRFAQVASSGRLATDPPGTTEAPTITQSSASSYDPTDDAVERWGDYSQTVVDPNDNQTFWTFQEYANATDSWGVRAIQLKAPAPATPSVATPSTVNSGSCAEQVDITGDSSDGSGFFDPGSGFPNHITASVTGGVVVRGVTYTDPTHITLNLDTTGASSGAQDVTVTNPDGQSETATGLVTVGSPVSGSITPCPTGTVPASPKNENNPVVVGVADPGSTVDVYTDPSCTGTPVGTGSAADFASPGIAVDPVADDSSTDYYVISTDGVTPSPCSSTLPGTSGFVTYVEDSTAPVPTVNLGPNGPTNDDTPRFTFSATDSVGPVAFECSIDTGTPSFGPCSGPGDSDVSSPLGEGPWTFRVRATDAAGNSATASRTFTVDVTPPTVQILSGPTGTTTDPRPTFTFSGDDPPLGTPTFECSIDTGSPDFGPCSGPGNADTPAISLANGSYAFHVQAIDSAGNTATAARLFAVNVPGPPPALVSPDTTITKGPKKKTTKPRPKFKFTASQAGSTFQCQVDNGQFAPCASPFKPAKLGLGKHVLRVRAIGPTGIADPAPAVKKFKVIA